MIVVYVFWSWLISMTPVPNQTAQQPILKDSSTSYVVAVPKVTNSNIEPKVEPTIVPAKEDKGQNKSGIASFYHNKFNGRKTATGETFSNKNFTAASNFFKLGTYIKVTNTRNGKVVYVKVNDRMGHPSRIADLTRNAASKLGFINRGTTKVQIQEVSAEEAQEYIAEQKRNDGVDTTAL